MTLMEKKRKIPKVQVLSFDKNSSIGALLDCHVAVYR